MKVAVGILAYNEELLIKQALVEVLRQDIFTRGKYDVELFVVANGCTDKTVIIAQEYLNSMVDQFDNLYVENIAEPGKSNAWNKFVHDLSGQNSDYLILMDADINLQKENIFSRLIETLEENKSIKISTSRPRKDIEFKTKKSLKDKISLKLSKVERKSYALCGQLYCIDGAVARNICLPAGLPVEDGFILAMVQTSNFTGRLAGCKKIRMVDNVYHVFEAMIDFSALYRHEMRLMIGSVINSFIYGLLWNAKFENNSGAANLIKEMNKNDHLWLKKLVTDKKNEIGFWVVPKSIMFKHFINWRKSVEPREKKIARLPLILAATFLTTLLAIHVNLYFKKQDGVGFW